MPQPKIPDKEPPVSKAVLRERQKTARRVYLDPSSPSVLSIVRVVVITMLILFIAGSVTSIIASLSSLFFMIVLSIFFAYLMDPLVKLIRRPFKQRELERYMPRSIAIVIAYLAVFTVVGIAISNLAPRVVDQAKELGDNIPEFEAALQQRANELNQRFDRLKIPDEIQADINRKATELASGVSSAFGNFLLNTASYLPWLILIPVIAFFFLTDVNSYRLAILRMFPAGRWRVRAESVLVDVNTTLAAYTRAQLISCIFIGSVCTLGFYIIGIKYALLFGIIAGIFEFIPLIGPLIIGGIVVLAALISDDPWKALYVAIFLLVLRIIQNFITYPRIVRGGLQMHPLVIILSVLAGQQVAGIPGVFLSIPIVAILIVFYRHVLEHQGKRGLFIGFIEKQARAEKES